MLAWVGSKYPHFKEATHLAGADPRGVNWVASHLLWVCSVHNTNSLFEHSLIYLNKLFSGRIINKTFRTRNPSSVACFILFMMVVEH